MEGKNLYFLLKDLFLKNGTTEAEAGRAIGIAKPNFNRKIKAGTLRATEVIDLLNSMGYSVYAEKNGEKIELK